MSKKFTSAYGVKHEDSKANDISGRCCVNGCPLTGTLGKSTRDNTHWYCQFHFFEHDTNVWAEITTRIKANIEVLKFFEDVRKNPQIYATGQKIVCHFNPKFNQPDDVENWAQYLDRAREYIRKAITSDLHRSNIEVQHSAESFFKGAAKQFSTNKAAAAGGE